MNLIKLKKLKSKEEIQSFIDGYNKAYSTKKIVNKQSLILENLMEYDYLFGIYKDGKLQGGFIVNKYPKRCLDSFNNEEQKNILVNIGENKDISEVVAIWKNSNISRFVLWAYTTLATLFYGEKYIFGCAYKGHGMTKNYYFLSPEFVKYGIKEDDLEVFYYTRIQFFLSFFAGAIRALAKNPIKLFFPQTLEK